MSMSLCGCFKADRPVSTRLGHLVCRDPQCLSVLILCNATYVQLYPVRDVVSALATAPCADVAEIWFETLEDAPAQFTSEHYTTVVAKDGEKFPRPIKTLFLFSHEKQIM